MIITKLAEEVHLTKKNDRVTKDGANNSHKVIDKLARSKSGDNARSLSVLHVDELAETSTFSNQNAEHAHQWMDENGWEHRKTYIQDKNGKIYEATLNIAKEKDRNILYDINNIKEIDHGAVPSQNVRLAHKNQSLNKSISQIKENTTEKPQFSPSRYLENVHRQRTMELLSTTRCGKNYVQNESKRDSGYGGI